MKEKVAVMPRSKTDFLFSSMVDYSMQSYTDTTPRMVTVIAKYRLTAEQADEFYRQRELAIAKMR